MTEPIFREVEHDLLRGWDAFTSHLPHRRYHDPEAAATPATEAPMSVIADIKTGLKDLAAKAEGIDDAVLTRVEAVEANPELLAVIDGAAELVHAPNAVQMVVNLLGDLKQLFPKPAAVLAPAEADPAMGQQPEPVPAS